MSVTLELVEPFLAGISTKTEWETILRFEAASSSSEATRFFEFLVAIGDFMTCSPGASSPSDVLGVSDATECRLLNKETVVLGVVTVAGVTAPNPLLLVCTIETCKEGPWKTKARRGRA